MKLFIGIIVAVIVLMLGAWLFTSRVKAPNAPVFIDEVTVFSDDNGQFTIQYNESADKALLSLSGVQYELDREPSASGARYVSADKTVLFWEKGGEALVEINGQVAFENAMTEGRKAEVLRSNVEGDPNINKDDSGGAGSETTTLTFMVGPEYVDCVGVGPMKCLMVNDQYFYDEIVGFDFEVGYEYELLVARSELDNVPADASSYTYLLIDILNKTKVASDSEADVSVGIEGTEWVWKGLVSQDGSSVTPEDPSQFIATFTQEENRFNSTTDCNSMFGSYSVEDSKLTFGPLASTMMACQDSLENTYSQALSKVERFEVSSEGQKSLRLIGPESILTFSAAE